MDPSQLFGAWLDDTTFLGGCLEISLDRFATTVQIEAYEVYYMSCDASNLSSGIPSGSNANQPVQSQKEVSSLKFCMPVKKSDVNIQEVNTKVLINCAVSAQLICIFVFPVIWSLVRS